jgi:hypothetical protein
VANDTQDWTSVSVSTEQLLPGTPFTVPADGAAHDLGTFTLPEGTQALGFTFPNPAQIALLSVLGTVSTVDYAKHSFAGEAEVVYVGVFPKLDTTVDIKVTTNAGGGNALVGVVILFGSRLTSLDPSSPQAVVLQTPLGFAVTSDVDASNRISEAVSLRFANPAPWQAGTQRAPINSVNVASNGVSVLVPGVANQHIYPGRYSFSEGGGNGAGGGRWTIQDTTGAAIADFLTSGNRGPVGEGTFEGEPLAVGVGLQVRNGGGNAEIFAGFLSYQQF